MTIVDIAIICLIMLLLGTMLGIVGVALVAFMACRKKRPAQALDPKQNEEPCETCVRWAECNGSDENCPRR